MCARGRTLSDPRIAPDGGSVAVVASVAGQVSLAVIPATGGPELVVTTEPAVRRGWGVFDWLPDSSGLVYVGADGALHVQAAGGGPATRVAMTEGAAAPAVAPDGGSVAYTVGGRHVAVADLDPDGPWPVRLSSSPDFCVDPVWSPDGRWVAWHEWDVPAMAWDDSRIVVADRAGARPPVAMPTPHPAAVAQPRFSPDGLDLGWLCDGAGWLNLWHGSPAGEGSEILLGEPHEHGGPTWGAGARTWVWSPDGAAIALTRNIAGFGELCVLDVGSGSVHAVDRGVFSGLSWAGGRLVALRSGATTPDQVVAYAGVGSITPRPSASAPARVCLARGPVLGFEAAGAGEPEVVQWDGEHVAGLGTEVHGRLFRTGATAPGSRDPGDDGQPPAPPLIIWVHGGPTGQHQVTFNPRLLYLLERGWNVLQVDPRGSTGWGRRYAQALACEWGRLDVADTVAGIRAAAAGGWGDPDRIVLMGASSAGLTVLSVLARHPGLCAAGIDLYGVTDLFALDETTHRFEAHYNPILLGVLPASAAVWRDRSPITHADAIVDPLLVLHGSADEVVLLSQSERLVATLAARGAPVEFHVYEGEGHGWSLPSTVADELSRIDAFLTRHVLRGLR